MKYFSEILNSTFDTAEECEGAENKYLAEKKAAEEEKARKASEVSQEKRELSKKIESADALLTEAYKGYEDAKKVAQEMLEKSNAEISSVLDAAKKKVVDAQNAKYDAIANFNKKFGAYKVAYTGDKAAEEFARVMNSYGSVIHNVIGDAFAKFFI